MRRSVLFFAVLLLPVCAFAQGTGVPPFGSFSRGQFDTINNANLNVFFAIPIMSSPGRGMNLSQSISYNSGFWTINNGAWTPSTALNPATLGWQPYSTTGTYSNTFTTTQVVCYPIHDNGTKTTTTFTNWAYTDPQGTVHPFAVNWKEVYNTCTNQDTISGTFTGNATDTSGYYIDISNWANTGEPVIIDRNGINFFSGPPTDRNGNYISSTGTGSETDWYDTVGRKALKIITGSSSIQYEFLDPTGAYQTTTVNLTSLNIKTNFGCPGIVEYSATVSLPTSIVLPNSQTYTISYEPTPGNSGYYTGRVQRVTLPTGGYYEYDYTGGRDGIDCVDGTTLGLNQVISDNGGNTATWNFVRNTSNSTTTVTTPKLPDTPKANDTVYTFYSTGQLSSVKIYAESPGVTLLRTVNTTWSGSTPATQVTILEDASTQSEVDTSYDSNGLLDSVSEYDWGTGAHGSLLRTTTLTYQTSSNYTSLNILGLVTSKVVKDSGGTVQYRQDTVYDGTTLASCPANAPQHNDSAYGCSFNYRGNPTQVTTYLTPGTPAGGISKNFTYDFFGNLLTAQLNCCQNKTWAYSSATGYSAPDSIQSGTSPSLTSSFTYNSSTGQVLTSTDPNGVVTTYSFDYLRRPTSVSQANGSTNGASVTYSYNDSAFTATTTASIDSSKSVQQIVSLEGLGRPNLSITEDAASNVYSKVSAVYDLIGRAYQNSNPYTGSSGSNFTTTAFDVLGRPTSITAPDGSSKTTYSYSAQSVTVTDPNGIARESTADAAGRLAILYEPDPTHGNQLIQQTSYTYNVLDELTQITQGSQTRSFLYDALGRLNSTTTPEGGQTCFGTLSGSACQSNGYDSFDNLLYRTDARGVLASYYYDGLNRPVAVAYNVGSTGVTAPAKVCKSPGASSNDSSLCIAYGTSASSFNNGLPTTLTDTVGSESYTYNALEQLTQLQKIINSTTYTMTYSSNLANELTSLTYPSGRVVAMPVDAIGRLCAVGASGATCTSGTTYATGYSYSPAGQLLGFGYGNGLYASFGFSSDMLQLTCLDYSTTNRSGTCTHDSTTKFGLTYTYPGTGSNNGMISAITDYVAAGRSVNYSFDALYRLTQAVTTGDSTYAKWGLAMTYDRYGNRTAQSIVSGTCVAPMTCPTNSVTVSAATNQITGSPYAYDANGNMTNDGVNTLAYDVENHVLSASGSYGSGSYTYDGNGLRVQKSVSGGATTVYIFSGSKVVAEYDNGAAPSSPSREYIYSGGALLAKIDSSGTKYYHQDHLSNRMVTNSSGTDVADIGHFPYGESWYNAAGDKLMFTTYERDAESGNDYAQARSYVNRLGRFSSLDPLPGHISDPQSLNRYSYVRNLPVILRDPAGMDPCGVFDAKNSPESGNTDAAEFGPRFLDWGTEPEPQEPPSLCDTSGGGGGGALLDDSLPLPDNIEMTVVDPTPTVIQVTADPPPSPDIVLYAVDVSALTSGQYGLFSGATGMARRQQCVPRGNFPLVTRLALDAMSLASKWTGTTYFAGLQASGTATGTTAAPGMGVTAGVSAVFATGPQPGDQSLVVSTSAAGTLGTPGPSGGITVGGATYQNTSAFSGPSFGWEFGGGRTLVPAIGSVSNSSGTAVYANVSISGSRTADWSPSQVSNGNLVMKICPH